MAIENIPSAWLVQAAVLNIPEDSIFPTTSVPSCHDYRDTVIAPTLILADMNCISLVQSGAPNYYYRKPNPTAHCTGCRYNSDEGSSKVGCIIREEALLRYYLQQISS